MMNMVFITLFPLFTFLAIASNNKSRLYVAAEGKNYELYTKDIKLLAKEKGN